MIEILYKDILNKSYASISTRIIYSITNLATGHSYIGKTITCFNKRYSDGKWWLHTHNQDLKQDAVLYGVDRFRVDILAENCSDQQLIDLELQFISSCNSLHPNGYNHQFASVNGYVSQKTRAKMSDSHKGRKFSESHKIALGQANKGKHSHQLKNRPQSEMHRARISQSKLKYKFTQEHINNIARGANHPSARKIAQLNMHGELVAQYGCISDAERQTGIDGGNIAKACRGKYRQSGGFKWKYLHEAS
jgi:group I intron endonuclease